MADVLVRAAPSKARTVNERMQADEIYKAGALRVILDALPRRATGPNTPRRYRHRDKPHQSQAFPKEVSTLSIRARIAARETSGDGRAPSLLSIPMQTLMVLGQATTARLQGMRTAVTGRPLRYVGDC